jgi:hypothetical protein
MIVDDPHPHAFDEDGYWADCVRRSGHNLAVNGWLDLVEYVSSGRADDRTLSGLNAALRSLSQSCRDQLHERRERARLDRYAIRARKP